MAPVIEVDDLRYTYPGRERAAVDGVGFRVGAGEVFGLLGPSGAGKTTTQRVLTRQHRRFDGQVRVLGRSLADWGDDYFEAIGVGFELPNHYLEFTALENLDFFASLYQAGARRRDPLELLARVGLRDDAHRKVADFSKGMRMRLNFVRALQHDPDVIFLDEPTAGLDPVNARNLKQIIRELRDAGKTIVLTTHNMHDVDELCDRVSFMVDGRFAAVDAPETLKARYGRRTVAVRWADTDGVLHDQEFDLDSLGSNAEFLDCLRGRELRTLHSQEASLDQVFAQVTGVQLSTGGAP